MNTEKNTKETIQYREVYQTPSDILITTRVNDAEQILIDNGIDPEEASTVLQAIGYVLLDVELYPEG